MLGLRAPVVLLVVVAVPKLLCDVASLVGLPPDKFGSMKPTITSIQGCAGPKRANCTELIMDTGGAADYNNVTFTMHVKRTVQILKVKVAIFSTSSPTPDVLKWVERPCDNFFFSPIFKKFFHTNGNCMIQKGTYTLSHNLTAQMYDFIGFNFFYGKYRSHTQILAKDCNVACVRCEFLIERRDKKTD